MANETKKKKLTPFQLDRRHLAFLRYLSPHEYAKEANLMGLTIDMLAPVFLYGGVIAGIGIGILFNSALTGFVAAIGGLWLPWFYLTLREETVFEAKEEQVETLAQSIAGDYSITKNIIHAMEQAVDDLEEPLKSRWAQLMIDYKSGRPLDELLDELEREICVREFHTLASILRVVERSGGDASETIKQVSVMIQSNRLLNAELRAELTQERSSYNTNLVLVGCLVVVFRVSQQDQFLLLAESMVGQFLFVGFILYVLWSLKAIKRLTSLRN